MTAGYVIAQLKVTNPENYKEYVAKVSIGPSIFTIIFNSFHLHFVSQNKQSLYLFLVCVLVFFSGINLE